MYTCLQYKNNILKNNSFTPLKILIIAPSWVGDLVMAQSLLKLLKQQNTFSQIHIVVSEYLVPLVQRMPEVEKILISPFKHGELCIRQRIAFAKKIQHENYDQAIVLPNSWKSALIPFFANIPKRTGWRGEMRYFLLNDIRILKPQKLLLMVERFLALGLLKNKNIPKNYFLPQLETTKQFIEQTLKKLNLTITTKPILAFCPGAEYGPAKRWPTNYFAKVAKEKVKEGWEIWLFGGNKDQEITAKIQEESGNVCIDLAGKTNLGEAIDLLSLSTFVVTNDTGLMHVAAALDKPMIAIYGSSSPSFTPPLSNKAKIISLNLECSPCFARVCPKNHFKCMQDLFPEMIIKFIHT